ncbi:hypothetical protein Barb6XT_00109 [Bacteroidales bacterium Barb6XT]|nr:hypothetical protein Barb6XT_00109 [Bacteroidales bacterium Barb6XT]
MFERRYNNRLFSFHQIAGTATNNIAMNTSTTMKTRHVLQELFTLFLIDCCSSIVSCADNDYAGAAGAIGR